MLIEGLAFKRTHRLHKLFKTIKKDSLTQENLFFIVFYSYATFLLKEETHCGNGRWSRNEYQRPHHLHYGYKPITR